MTPKKRLGRGLAASANKLKLDSLNKILKIDTGNKKQRKDQTTRQLSRVALTDLLKNSSYTVDVSSDKSLVATTLTSRSQEPPNFRLFLKNKEYVKEFKDYLKTQYCEENIDFYTACEKYKNLDPEKVGNEMVKFMATQIFNDYLSDNARQRVNINSQVFKSIQRNMKNPQPNLLDDAQSEIYDLMRSDCFPRFCKTWPLNKELAHKMLVDCSTNRDSKIQQVNPPTPFNNTSTLSSEITSSYLSSMKHSETITSISSRGSNLRRSTRLSGSNRLNQNLEQLCPTDCPYNNVGLPCLQHASKPTGLQFKTSDSNLIDRIDLRTIHKVPKTYRHRTPPPPPLPPKPFGRLPQSPDDKRRPYVGKVFHV